MIIDKNIPIPKKVSSLDTHTVWDTFEVGDSAEFPKKEGVNMAAYLRGMTSKRGGKVFTRRTVGENKDRIRIWRVR